MKSFDDSFHVEHFDNAKFFAKDLFFDSFAIDFPVPRDGCGRAIPTPARHWHQYVAFYEWESRRFEAVGFCNWIRFDDVYLEGGLCVSRNFYRRLPRSHWDQCHAAGGVAQLIMEAAARQLNDCSAWFGYCGDKKASIVDARVGFLPTRYQYLIVKWFQDPPPAQKDALIEKLAAIGPF